MTWIQTYSGRRFSLTEPSAEDVDIDDVAHAPGEVCEDLLRAAGSFGAGVLDLDTRETVRVTHSGQEAQR